MRQSVRWGVVLGIALAGAALPAQRCLAWGPEVHRVVALLAQHLLQQSDPGVAAKVEAVVASDTEERRAKPTIADEAVWPDELLARSEEARIGTSGWHYVRLKFDNPDLAQACFGHPPLPIGYPASHGPENNCAVDKIAQFATELSDPATSAGERLLALRYVLNLVADIHDPLYMIDHGDDGGRCVAVRVGDAKTPVRLLTYWQHTLAIEVVGRDLPRSVSRIGESIAPADAKRWAAGTPASWALETYQLAKAVTYSFLGQKPVEKYAFPPGPGETDRCGPVEVYRLGSDYETKGLIAVKEQIAKAGLRLALTLHDHLR